MWPPRTSRERTDAAHEVFIGRGRELTIFRRALRGGPDAPRALYVSGMGGIGKSSFLRVCGRIAARLGVTVTAIDLRNIEGSPEAVLDELARVRATTIARADPGPEVVLFDTYEMAGALDTWFQMALLPKLVASALVVVAGRDRPSARWHTLPFRFLALPLAALTPLESRQLLSARQVPTRSLAALSDLAHGHPLALALLGEVVHQRPHRGHPTSLPPAWSSDAVRTLIGAFLDDVPSAEHRLALEAACVTRTLSEPLLTAMLESPAAHDLFRWLEGLSFVHASPHGLALHDVARDALAAELRWRSPQRFAALIERAYRFYSADPLADARATVRAMMYLQTHNPIVRSFFASSTTEADHWSDAIRDDDIPAVLAMTRRHEGDEAVRVVEHWLVHQRGGFEIMRDARQVPLGFVLTVGFDMTKSKTIDADPGMRSLQRFVRRHAPLRADETAFATRMWMADDLYQGLSPARNIQAAVSIRRVLTQPRLGLAFQVYRDPEAERAMHDYGGMSRVAEADFAIGDARYGAFMLDLRLIGREGWLAHMSAQAARIMNAQVGVNGPAPRALERDELARALRAALKDFTAPAGFGANPLLEARSVLELAATTTTLEARSDALRELIRRAADGLDQPRTTLLHQALALTYLAPTPKQRAAAHGMGVPFGTYRRHLSAAVSELERILWQWETGPHRADPMSARAS